jgi:hypothetical protein
MDKNHILADKNLIDTALAAVRELGIDAEVERRQPKLGRARADALIRVRHGDQEILYAAEVKRGLRPAFLGAVLQQLERLGEQALLVTDYVTPPLADELRARRVAFMDAAGNAYLDRPPLLVWVKGQRPAKGAAAQTAGRIFQAGGLQVIFALLCDPERANLPYREIAKLAGVAHGTVGWVMAELLKLGFIAGVGGKRRLLQSERLLQQWVEAYARTLRVKLVLGRFKAEKLDWWKAVDPLKYELTMGGEGAAARLTHHLRPGTLTFYGEKVEPRFLLDHRLRTHPAGEVEIMRRFWGFDNDDPALTPTLLVYADLLVIGDARCLETAKRLYDGILAGLGR